MPSAAVHLGATRFSSKGMPQRMFFLPPIFWSKSRAKRRRTYRSPSRRGSETRNGTLRLRFFRKRKRFVAFLQHVPAGVFPGPFHRDAFRGCKGCRRGLKMSREKLHSKKCCNTCNISCGKTARRDPPRTAPFRVESSPGLCKETRGYLRVYRLSCRRESGFGRQEPFSVRK